MENNDVIVYLNVGGKKMATKRSTLCQVDGSLLASMFSGRWEDNIERDEDGHVFLDYNPKLFAIVLDYLRAKKTETPSKPALLPPVSLKDNVRFRSLVEYLGVDSTNNNKLASVESKTASGQHKFEFHSEGIYLSENDTRAYLRSSAPRRHEYVITGKDEVHATSNTPWRLHLQSVKPNGRIFVGVLMTKNRDCCISNSRSQRAKNTYLSPSTWRGSYGWILGQNSQTCIDGNISPTSNFGGLGAQGDTVELHISSQNFHSDRVSLLLRPSGLKLSIDDLPPRETWQCVIGLCHPAEAIILRS